MLQNYIPNISNSISSINAKNNNLLNKSAFSLNQTASSFIEIENTKNKEDKIISIFTPVMKPMPIYSSNAYSSSEINQNFQEFIPFLNNIKIDNKNNANFNFIGKKKYINNNEILIKNEKTKIQEPFEGKENENNSNLSAFKKLEITNDDESFYNSIYKNNSFIKKKSFNKKKYKKKILNKIIINETNNFIKNSEINNNNNNSIKKRKIFKSIRYQNKSQIQNINQNKDIDQNIDEGILNLKKRRGRKPTIETKRVHNASDYDNILRKIQVHFLTFIIFLANDLIEAFLPKNKDLKFKNLDYDIKKPVNHSYVEQLKNKTIGEILQLKASSKNKKFDSSINEIIYNKVCKLSPVLKNFFELSYLEIFNEYYYKNKNTFCLEGINVNMSQRTKVFNDLLDKNIGEAEKIQLIVSNNYIKPYKKPIFVINKKK